MSSGTSSVFLVDDDISMREALENLFRSVGLKVKAFGTAQEFLASERPDSPHCLVLDVRLPGASGLDLQRHLRTKGSTVPIVVMTAFESARVRDEAYRLGCAGVLDKQADIDEILRLIRSF